MKKNSFTITFKSYVQKMFKICRIKIKQRIKIKKISLTGE